ncbi:hypothetical protein [Actinomadura rugatobispora]|uniref:Uncharacterized protein n=1 Tax=Actinomadura rugatobispora TaxID=1994 RepID=A0ABW0ZVE5_9ACTN|nr:hypothetical protein GCM10010200_035860 [Actinomadura rugatobispora]
MAEPTIIVRLDGGPKNVSEYGPFTTRHQAEAFAAFMSAEVDPARVLEAWGVDPEGLLSPVGPLLAWYADSKERPVPRRPAIHLAVTKIGERP